MAARDNTTRAALARAAASADKNPQPFNTAASSSGSDKGRITVDLSPELYRRFKTSCAWNDRQMNEVVRELVAAWLEDHPIG